MQSGEFDNPELPRPVSHRPARIPTASTDGLSQLFEKCKAGRKYGFHGGAWRYGFQDAWKASASGTTTKTHAKLAPTLANLARDIVTVIAYLYILSRHRQGIRGETPRLARPQIANYNFRTATTSISVWAFDKTLADQILQTKTTADFRQSPRRWDKTSVVAEMTRTPAAQK